MMTAAESAAWEPQIPGYSEDVLPFYSFIQERIPQGGTFAEVGVYQGRSFAFMALLRPDLHAIAVDAWTVPSLEPSRGDATTLQQFWYHMKRLGIDQRIHVIQDDSATAIAALHPVDFLFLDGDHNYPGVRRDIEAGLRVVKRGGVISGHDYAGDNGVCQAVRELVPGYQVSDFDAALPGAAEGKGRCWWKVMP